MRGGLLKIDPQQSKLHQKCKRQGQDGILALRHILVMIYASAATDQALLLSRSTKTTGDEPHVKNHLGVA